MRILGFALCAALSLAGCQTDNPTASGSPEITIAVARPDQVKPLLVNAALNRGMKMKGDTPYQVTFERPWGNQAGAALVGALISADASSVVERLTFSIAESGSGTRVVLDRYMVKIARFGREEASLANGNAPGLDNLQATLDGMAPSLTPAPQQTTAPMKKPGT